VRREAANRVTINCWYQRQCGAVGVDSATLGVVCTASPNVSPSLRLTLCPLCLPHCVSHCVSLAVSLTLCPLCLPHCVSPTVSPLQSNVGLEMQQRACEYGRLLDGHDAMRPALLEPLPPMREELLAGAATALGIDGDGAERLRGHGGGGDAGGREFLAPVSTPQPPPGGGCQTHGVGWCCHVTHPPLNGVCITTQVTTAPADALGDLLGMDMLGDEPPPAGGSSSGGGGGADFLSDLLGGDLTIAAPAANGVDALADLFGGSPMPAGGGAPLPYPYPTLCPPVQSS
jgi:hypothetical protein